MVSFSSTPGDIICGIVRHVSGDNTGSLSCCVRILPLLAVCQDWRATTAPILYKTLFVTDERRRDASKDIAEHTELSGSTNIKLAIANGFQGMARTLCFDFPIAFTTMPCLFHVVESLSLTDKDCPAIHQLCTYLTENANYTDPIIEVDAKMAKDIETVAIALTQKLPNIQHLEIHDEGPGKIVSYFWNSIIQQFNGKLTRLKYNGDMNIAGQTVVTGVQQLDIALSTGITSQTLQFCPHSPRKLSITCDGSNFPWTIFDSNELNANSFMRLESLHLASSSTNFFALGDMFSLKYRPKYYLNFSELRTATIQRVPLGAEISEAILRAPIKDLCLETDLTSMHELCQHDISGLNRLSLKPVSEVNTSSFTQFVRDTNNIFNKTHDIGEVHFRLTVNSSSFDFAGVRWPHLTHLEVIGSVELEYIVLATRFMPNLTRLHMDMTSLPSYDQALEFLRAPDEFPDPFNSKLAHLSIAEYDEQLIAMLSTALPNLKQLFPKLVSITVG